MPKDAPQDTLGHTMRPYPKTRPEDRLQANAAPEVTKMMSMVTKIALTFASSTVLEASAAHLDQEVTTHPIIFPSYDYFFVRHDFLFRP